MRCGWRVVFLVLLITVLVSTPAPAQQSVSCFDCHADSGLTKVGPQGQEISLFVDSVAFRRSVHFELGCVACHVDIQEIPHPEKLAEVDCGMCHELEKQGCLEGAHGKARTAGDPDAPKCSDCHGHHDIVRGDDPQSRVHPRNQPKTCAKCHADRDFVRRHGLPSALPPSDYERSVHAQAIQRGVKEAPSCSDCHLLPGTHVFLEVASPQSPVNPSNVASTCGRCHDEIANTYMGSAHGTALARGVKEAPTCNFCHGEHRILTPREPGSPVRPERVSEAICAPCHASETLNEKLGLPSDRVSTYLNSYHGLAVRRGSKVAANCASCHGIHNIYRQDDPRSTVHPNNLAKTCGTCHPGASEQFARVKVHSYRSEAQLKAASIIRSAYVILILLVIGGMVVHNLIVWLFFAVEKYRKTRAETGVRRFDTSMIVQHILLLVAFITLVITGFALKFPNSFLFRLLLKIGVDEALRGLLHRIAASVLIATAIYHFFWAFFTRHGRREIRRLVPNVQDLLDLLQTLRYYLRLSPERPQYQKYNYIEKAEYWALVWGTVVMVSTGLILWFPETASRLLGPWAFPIAEIIHYYEAWLATLAIAVWHFYWVIFHPDEYPMSFVWLHGKMPHEEAMKHRLPWLAEESRELRAEEKSRTS
ncbi:MAG: cytochrome b/b6 domain-containing protein [candidate division KSB1 bacterium]|nr:cytochrome b/b6 domain-containing protein [candidate division KSB1 bacterium]